MPDSPGSCFRTADKDRSRSGCIRLHSRRSGRHGAGSPRADILWRRSCCRHPHEADQHPAPDRHDHHASGRRVLEFLPCLFHFFSPRLAAQAVKTFWRSALPLESIQSSKLTPLIASSRLASSREGRLFSQKILARVAGLTPSHSATWYCRIVFMTLFVFHLKTFSKRKFAFCLLLVRRMRGAAAGFIFPMISGGLRAGWYGWRCTGGLPQPDIHLDRGHYRRGMADLLHVFQVDAGHPHASAGLLMEAVEKGADVVFELVLGCPQFGGCPTPTTTAATTRASPPGRGRPA